MFLGIVIVVERIHEESLTTANDSPRWVEAEENELGLF
jgi:hypothetical protein